MKQKLMLALKRAAWTAAETALGMIPVGVGIEAVNWKHVLSVVALTAILSLLKSVVVGMPEMQLEADTQDSAGTLTSEELETLLSQDRDK